MNKLGLVDALVPGFSVEAWAVIAATLIVAAAMLLLGAPRRSFLQKLLAALFLSLIIHQLVRLLDAAAMVQLAMVARGLAVLAIGFIVLRIWVLALFHQWLPALQRFPPRILEDIVLFVAFIGWGMARLHEAGVHLSQLIATSAVLTAVLAFAMQDTLGNILSGLALQWDESIQVGDWVKLDEVSGRVMEMTWRATYVETRNGENVLIPNSQLTKHRFQVIGRVYHGRRLWRRWVFFNVTLETLPTQIIAMVEEALGDAALVSVAPDPRPDCILMSTEQGVGHFAVRYWLEDFACDDKTDSLVRTAIDAALRRQGRRLSAPQHSVLLALDNKRFSESRHKRHTQERLSTLRRLELLAALTDDELATLAERLRFTPFVNGDVVVRQGDIVEWLYIVIRGEIELITTTNAGERHSVARLGRGDFFGELSLMTGEAFPHSAIARSPVECFRLDRDTFQTLLLAREELADEFSRVLTRRIEERLARLAKVEPNPAPAPQHGEVRQRIRRFFGLAE